MISPDVVVRLAGDSGAPAGLLTVSRPPPSTGELHTTHRDEADRVFTS